MNFKDNSEASVSTLFEKLNVILLSATDSCLIRPPITRKKYKLRRNHKHFLIRILYKMKHVGSYALSYARTVSKYSTDPFVRGRVLKIIETV